MLKISYALLNVIFITFTLIITTQASEKSGRQLSNERLFEFAEQYFQRWSASQNINATIEDIDAYLSLLRADVGHQHLPYSHDDSRKDGSLGRMREGMTYYLGAHSSYSSELLNVMVDLNVVVIKYLTKSSGVHPQTKALIKQEYTTIEVLELEDGKVSVIRKYSE